MKMAGLPPISHESMKAPATAKLVIVSLVAALLVNLIPWEGVMLLVRPDFLLLMLLYWTVHEPRRIGQGTGFFLALLMDVADSALLGQHALVYVMAIFLAQTLRLRIHQLSLAEQALHIGAILLVSQSVTLFLNFLLGRDFPGFAFFVAPVLGGLLWPAIGVLTGLPHFHRPPPTVIQ
jgi:rod shape-determining protein MreD